MPSEENEGVHVPRLREVRLRRLLTQADLARLAGISKTTVNQVEQGRHPARISTVRKLANALGVESMELLAGEQEARQ